MASEEFVRGIVKLRDVHGRTLGAGFLAEGTKGIVIVTCAHVVDSSPNQETVQGAPTTLRAVFRSSGDEKECIVWRIDKRADIAILRLQDELPGTAVPLRLGSSTQGSLGVLRTMGFPAGSEEGVFGEAQVVGRMPEEHLIQLRSREITEGFSGAPVWDPSTGLVVGMISCIHAKDRFGRLSETAYAVPSEEIAKICPELPLHNSSPQSIHAGSHLSRLLQESIARCIELWQGAGVPLRVAKELAENPDIGSPEEWLHAKSGLPVNVIVGDFGSGKSLLAERIFQRAVQLALGDPHAPIPVYARATEVTTSLRDHVETVARQLGEPEHQGVMLVIDGADEVTSSKAWKLLSESRFLANLWPHTRVIITSRPMPILEDVEECVHVPPLTEKTALQLMSRVLGEELTLGTYYSWPEPVREAVRRPLFALLLAGVLRDRERIPSSKGELISRLVDRALQRSDRVDNGYFDKYVTLARLITDRGGGSVTWSELLTDRKELDALLDSRLVVRRADTLAFALPILTQWFAAQSLAKGEPNIEDLLADPERLERWRYALTVFVGTFGHDIVSRMLAPLVRENPGFAAEIVTDGISAWGPGSLSLPTALECGQQIRSAMESWLCGLGPLAQLMTNYVDLDGRVRTLGVRKHEEILITAWYHGSKPQPDVVLLPPDVHPLALGRSYEWREILAAPPGPQPGWAWSWALEQLRGTLKDLITQRRLCVPDGELSKECAWYTALVLLDKGMQYEDPIPLDTLETTLDMLTDADEMWLRCASGKLVHLTCLRKEIRRLRAAGQKELTPPWPTRDIQSKKSGWLWEFFTDEQILARTVAVYQMALRGYDSLVKTWFPRLRLRMRTAAILPARLKGVLIPPRRGQGFEGGPTLSWYLEPLPLGSSSVVDITIGDKPYTREILDELSELYRSMRPKAAEWAGPTLTDQFLDIWGPHPATQIVYSWLEKDLRRVHWLP